jgi:NitT/TauT family transport system substrate-binding protein
MVTALGCMSVAACGGGSSQDGGSGRDGDASGPETTNLTVGVLPFAEVSPLYVAAQQGLFEAEGLTVTPQIVTGGGAATITGVVSGDTEIAYTAFVSLLQAASKGLMLQVVRENDRPSDQGIFTLPASGISSPADLAGKKIAVNALGNVQELTTRSALKSNGVDPDSVEFVELAPADAVTALSAGDVDAAWFAEPFVSIATANLQAQRVVDAFSGAIEDMPVGGWATSPQFAKENPKTIAAFTRAMDAAIDMVKKDPSLMVDILPTYSSITPELAAQISPPNWVEESRPEDMSVDEELMREFGLIDEKIDVDELIFHAPR